MNCVLSRLAPQRPLQPQGITAPAVPTHREPASTPAGWDRNCTPGEELKELERLFIDYKYVLTFSSLVDSLGFGEGLCQRAHL